MVPSRTSSHPARVRTFWPSPNHPLPRPCYDLSPAPSGSAYREWFRRQSTRPAGSPSRSVPGCPHSVPFGAKLIVPHGGTAGTCAVQALAVHCHERQWMARGFTGCSLYRMGWTPRMRAGHCLGGAGRSVPRRLRSHRHSLDPIRCQFQNSQAASCVRFVNACTGSRCQSSQPTRLLSRNPRSLVVINKNPQPARGLWDRKPSTSIIWPILLL